MSLDEGSLRAARIGVLQAGMPVEVYLRVRSRTAIGYLFDPVTQSLAGLPRALNRLRSNYPRNQQTKASPDGAGWQAILIEMGEEGRRSRLPSAS